MKKSSKVLALALATVMAVAPVMSVSAAEWQGPEGNGVDNKGDGVTAEMEEYGHTTFSIIQAKQNPNNVSFEVPLYVTMAALDDKVDVAVPTNYSITNTSAKLVKDGGVNELATEADGYNIAVVRLQFTSLAGATYSTVEDLTDKGASDMKLTIGGVVMPAITASLTDETTIDADIKAAGSVFYTDGTGYTVIPANETILGDGTRELMLPITATLGAATTYTNTGAAAQFKVKYTVSALDGSGNLMGSVYAGDDRVTAGLAK